MAGSTATRQPTVPVPAQHQHAFVSRHNDEREEETMSFSLSWNDDFDDDSSTALIALPSPKPQRNRYFHTATAPVATARTPLNPRKRARRKTNNTSVLFGPSLLDSRQEYKPSYDGRPTGLAGFFFGFMYEEPMVDDDEEEEIIPQLPIWNRLNRSLFVTYALSSAAAAVPVALVPFLDFVPSTFVSTAAASAVLGTACGKFLNGPVGDVFGARRVSTVYGILLALSLFGLSCCQSASSASWALFLVEFFQSVQWPCIVIILAAHYGNSPGMYEGGIYVTCLASRLGSLLAIPLSSLLLRSVDWRTVAHCGALVALMGSFAMFWFVRDAPSSRHAPQNPIHVHFLEKRSKNCTTWLYSVIKSLVMETLIPSIKEVLKSGTFWIVAIAHAGATMVRSSNRILGTYFYNTSNLSFSRAGGLAVMLDFGILLGLGIGGNAFAMYNQRQRKRLVARLYMLAIGACYVLAFLAIPKVRNNWMPSNSFTILLQIVAVLAAGVGVAVQCFHIPGLVGATFGHNKGLYAAYTDGVAYGLASIVWRIVGGAVEEGNPQGGGWAYGWAAVALLVVLCAVLMVEFMEHYFCRTGGCHRPSKDGYETIIFV